MDYYCDLCLKSIKPNSKFKHFKSNSHQEYNKCKHILLCHKNIDINDVDEAFYSYNIEHNKIFHYYLKKCEFKIVFNDYQFYPYVTSKLSDNKTMVSWKNLLMKVIDDFKDKGYTFKHIAELHNITNAHKKDMLYDFYINYNMCALEWKLNALIQG